MTSGIDKKWFDLKPLTLRQRRRFDALDVEDTTFGQLTVCRYVAGSLCLPESLAVLLEAPLTNRQLAQIFNRAVHDQEFLAAMEAAVVVGWHQLVVFVSVQHDYCVEHLL